MYYCDDNIVHNVNNYYYPLGNIMFPESLIVATGPTGHVDVL